MIPDIQGSKPSVSSGERASASAETTEASRAIKVGDGPSSEFCSALSEIQELRGKFRLSDALLDASTWAQHSLFDPLVSALQRVKDTVINRHVLVPVTAFMTFVFNPVLFSELRAGGGATIAQFAAASNSLNESLLGRMFLNVVQSVCNNPLVIESNSLISPNNDPVTNAFLLSGGLTQIFILGYPVVRTVEYILTSANRRERAKQGLEPLPTKSRPSLVVAADSAFADVLMEKLPSAGLNWRAPTVLAHPDDKTPAAYERRDSEFHVRFPTSDDRPFVSEVMRRTGMDRARQIVVGAFNHTKAIFYGNDSKASISPSFCTTLLGHLASQKNCRTEQVVLILPKQATLLGTKPFAQLLADDQQLMETVRRQNIWVGILHPEDVIMNLLAERLAPLLSAHTADPTKQGTPFNICLIGDENYLALKNFSTEIESRFPNVKVSIIADGVVGDVGPDQFKLLTKKERLENQHSVLARSDLNLVYSDVDSTTTDLAGLFADGSAGDANQEKRQTIVIMETPDGAKEARNLNYDSICLYEGIREIVAATLANAKSSRWGRRAIAAN